MIPLIKTFLSLSILFLLAQGCSTSVKREKKILPITSADDVLQNLQPAEEIFDIKASEENLLKGEKGTVIFIPPNAFRFADGTAPTAKVSLELKECYSLSNIISENLSTLSNNQFLQTAGMIYLKASADGKELFVKDGKAIAVGFPKKNQTDTMELFYNYNDNKGNRTWVVDYRAFEADAALTAQADTTKRVGEGDSRWSPEYPVEMTDDLYDVGLSWCLLSGTFTDLQLLGLNKNILDYIDDLSNIPDSVARQFINNKWRVHLNFKIDKNGKMYDFKVEDDENTKYNAYAVKTVEDLLRKAPPFDMSTYDDRYQDDEEEKFRCRYSLGVMGSRTINWERFKAKFRNKFAEYKNKAIQKLDKTALDYYMFSATKLGWINCDRFLDLKEEKTDYVVKTNNAQDCKVQILFTDINSIMNGTLKDGAFVFTDVPLNRKVKIIGISYLNGKPTMASMQTTINKNGAELNAFKEFSLDELEAELNTKK